MLRGRIVIILVIMMVEVEITGKRPRKTPVTVDQISQGDWYE